MSVLESALEYLESGYSIVPVTPGAKYPPLVKWTHYQTIPPSEAQVREWWGQTPNANIAIITGQTSDLSVIDVDGDEGTASSQTHLQGLLPDSRVHKTPHGLHLLLRYSPGLKQTVGILPGIDIRSEGGYILAPPSVVDGLPYTLLKNVPVAEMTSIPPALDTSVVREPTGNSGVQDSPTWVSDALDNGAELSTRNKTAASLIGYFHSRGLPRDIILSMMSRFAENCSPPMDRTEMEKTIESVTRYVVLAKTERITNPPVVHSEGELHIYSWADLHIEVRLDGMYQSREGIKARLEIVTDLPDQLRHVLGPVTWGLSSTSGRNSILALLNKGSMASLDWTTLLDIVARLASATFEEGEPAISLSEPQAASYATYAVAPLVMEGETTVLFGDGGTAKSYISLALAAAMQTGDSGYGFDPRIRHRGLYADWETNAETQKARLRRLSVAAGVFEDPPDIVYKWCELPLASHVRQLKRLIDECSLSFIIIDSAASACDGEPERAETALRFFQALRSLRVTSLVICHVKKTESGGRPFGSSFWHNAPRATFEIIGQEDNAEDQIKVGVFHRKSNDGPLVRPFGLTISFGDSYTAIDHSDIQDEEGLAERTQVWLQIAHLLKAGPKTTEELELALPSAKSRTVARTLARGRGKRFTQPDPSRPDLWVNGDVWA